MNRTMSTLIAIGLGAATYRVMQKNNTMGSMMTTRPMKKMSKMVTRMFD